MSDEGGNSAEKEFAPSEKRLADAREKGEIPRSADLTMTAAYLGLLIAMATMGAWMVTGIGTALATLLDQADRLAPLTTEAARSPVGGLLRAVVLSVAPVFVLPASAAMLMLIAQRAIVLAPSKLAPRLSRISPLSGLQQKFGRNGLFEFCKNTVKLVLTGALLAWFLAAEAGRIAAATAFSPAIAATEMMRHLTAFLVPVCVLAAVIGGIDYLWQRAEHLRKHRMTRKEMTDEMKNSEGDPHVKAQRRQRGHDIATNRMLLDVAGADVVIVNPVHYAVALKWDRKAGRAPVCVAKGVDEVAARIRSLAAEAGVPLHRDPPTARLLHAALEVGAEIRPEHYRAVAAAIRFSEAMRKRSLWRRARR